MISSAPQIEADGQLPTEDDDCLELVMPGHDLGLDTLVELLHSLSMLTQLPKIKSSKNMK